jgi:hypothetical protein
MKSPRHSDLMAPVASGLAGWQFVAPIGSFGQALSAGFDQVRRRLSPDR